jgi:protein-S-isoprenylcysteine O-methyltransferase Ste14
MSGATRAVIAGIWIVWLAYWLLAAFATKRTVERGDLFGYRLVALVLVVALLAVFGLFGLAPESVIWNTPAAVAIACVCVVAAGAAFAVWARIVLGRNWSAEVTFKQGHELIESGPYALVRHPIYTGLLTMGLGTAIDYGRPSGIALLVGLSGAFWVKARQEEKIMELHFPTAYAEYKARVPAIIPFLMRRRERLP